MKTTLTILAVFLIATIYAIIRAKHDSHIQDGKWKPWAFAEGVFIAVCVVSALIWGIGVSVGQSLVSGAVFAFLFWLVFDCFCGLFRVGNILYLGSGEFDAEMKGMCLYNKPIFGWKETGAIRLIFFKVFWITFWTLIYFAL